jgi:hypothetical protein
MKKSILVIFALVFFTSCTARHNPFVNVGASKSVNIGGIDVGVGIHDIIQLGR